MDLDADDHQLVFVGGLHGSGSSRVATLLGHHRLVSAPRATLRPDRDSDTVRASLDTAAALLEAPDDWARLPDMHLTEASPECLPESAEALWDSWEPFWDLSKGVLLERSTSDLVRARFLQALFPGSYFIMVMRHPIAVVEAGRTRSGSRRSQRLENWIKVHEAMAADLPHLDHVLVVRYEDLVTSTEREYRRILEFLDLAWAPTVTQLDLGGNEAYYLSFAGRSPSARLSAQKALRDFGPRVERFGYHLRPPYVEGSSASRTLGFDLVDGADETDALTTAAPLTGAHFPASIRVPAHTRLPVEPDTETAGAGTAAAGTVAAGTAAAATATAAGTVGAGTVDMGSSDERATPAHASTGSTADTGGSRRELRRAARGGFAFTVGILVTAIFQFGWLKLLTHSLDQSDFGAFAEALAVFTICTNTAELGADTGLMRFAPIFHRRRPGDLRRLAAIAVGPAFVFSTLAAILLFVFAPQLVHLVVHHAAHKGSSTALRILACFLPAVTLTTVMGAGLRAWTTRVVVMINGFLLPIARPLLLAAFIILGVTLKLATIAYVIPAAIGFALTALVLVGKLRGTPAKPGELPASYRAIATEFWRFSLPRTFAAVLQILLMSLDVLLVGAFLDARKAAAYSVASRYIVYGTFGLQAVVASVMPQMSRLMDARDLVAVKLVYKSSTWWTIAACWPVLLVLAIFAPLFLSVFGHGYLIASSALTILAIAMLANTGTGASGPLLQMAGRSGVSLVLQAMSLAINIGLNVWLIPRIGIVGAAIAWMASIVFNTILTSTIIWRNFGVEPFGTGYWMTAGAAVGCFGVLGLATRLAFGTSVVAFLLFGIVSSVLYVLVLYRWRRTLNLDAFESLYSSVFRRARNLRAAVAGGRRV